MATSSRSSARLKSTNIKTTTASPHSTTAVEPEQRLTQSPSKKRAAVSALESSTSVAPGSPDDHQYQLLEREISPVHGETETGGDDNDTPLDIEIVLKPQHNVSSFLVKLYNLVSDKNSNHLIRWSDDGQSFFVLNPEKLTHDLIPRFFKHSNYASFVRQLNMYGFRKVSHILQGALKSSEPEVTEFQNPFFIRDRPGLLSNVKRKVAKKTNPAPEGYEVTDLVTTAPTPDLQATTTTASVHSLRDVLRELSNIKRSQMKIENELHAIQTENEHIWQESQAQRLKHESQQQVINKILRFLASVFSSDKVKGLQTADFASALGASPVTNQTAPRRRAPLLLEPFKRQVSRNSIVHDGEIIPFLDSTNAYSVTSPSDDITPSVATQHHNHDLNNEQVHQRLVDFMSDPQQTTLTPSASWEDLTESHNNIVPNAPSSNLLMGPDLRTHRLSHEIANLDNNINDLVSNFGLTPEEIHNLDEMDPQLLNEFLELHSGDTQLPASSVSISANSANGLPLDQLSAFPATLDEENNSDIVLQSLLDSSTTNIGKKQRLK